jgi:hypothetical protein
MTEKECVGETKKHIDTVYKMISVICLYLKKRSHEHDASKLLPPEFETFMLYTDKLKGSTYGSPEYKQFLEGMKPALDHHYAHNSHHPEHYVNGVDGMDIIDLVEMLCDWKAATLRHADGSLNRSIDINADRFKLSDQLKNIFKNSVDLFEGVWYEYGWKVGEQSSGQSLTST